MRHTKYGRQHLRKLRDQHGRTVKPNTTLLKLAQKTGMQIAEGQAAVEVTPHRAIQYIRLAVTVLELGGRVSRGGGSFSRGELLAALLLATGGEATTNQLVRACDSSLRLDDLRRTMDRLVARDILAAAGERPTRYRITQNGLILLSRQLSRLESLHRQAGRAFWQGYRSK